MLMTLVTAIALQTPDQPISVYAKVASFGMPPW